MTTIQPNYNYATQPVQAVAPTTGTPNNTVNPYQQYQQPVNYTQQQPVNTSNPAQLQQMQQQYVSQIPQATDPADRLGSIDTSTVEGIDEFVKEAYNMSKAYTQAPQAQAQAVAPAVAPQAVQPTQQVAPATTPVAQNVNTQVAQTQQQQQINTVQPPTGTGTQNQLAYNPQTTQPQQTKPPTVGSSDGQGNILMSDPQTGQLQWMPQEQVLAMYQNSSNGNRGKVQLPNGSWVDKSTAESAVAKLEGILEARKLADSGVINEEQLKRLVGDQDLIGILGPSVESRNEKARERMKAAVDGGASGTSLADVGGNANPYSGFTPSAGGGEAS